MQTLKLRDVLARIDGASSSGLEAFISRLNEHLGIKLDNTNGPFLAGGAVRRAIEGAGWAIHEDTDFDLFFKSEEQYQQIRKILMEGVEKDTASPNTNQQSDEKGWICHGAVSVKYKNSTGDVDNFLIKYVSSDEATQETIYKVQLVKKHFFENAAQLIDFFDFTICQFATDGDQLLCGDYALWDLGRKRLVVHKITYPVSSMRRMIKYTKQGFYVCNLTMTLFLQAVAADPKIIETRFEYVD